MNKGFRDTNQNCSLMLKKMAISWYVIGFFNYQISQVGSTTCPHFYLFIQNKMSLFLSFPHLFPSALRWWVFIWTTGGWIAGWAWVCCFSMPSSCSAPSSSGRCEALRSKVDPIRHAEYLPFYRASSFLKPKKKKKKKSEQVVVFLVRVSVQLCRIRSRDTVQIQLHKYTLKSSINSIIFSFLDSSSVLKQSVF